MTESLLVTDSRGVYDAISASDSPLLGMVNARTGVEAMAVQKGIREVEGSLVTSVGCHL